MAETSIEWTDKTWNPVRGCSRASLGCGGAAGGGGCYAERQAARFSGPGMPYEGLVRIGKQGPRWTGVVRLVPEMLDAPLHWRKPRRVFVNSMSDLFHEALSNEQIAAVFGVMAACPQHTFQVLTKRARRMREWFAWASGLPETLGRSGAPIVGYLYEYALRATGGRVNGFFRRFPTWPFPNVHLGVSVEDQETWDARTAELRRCPAAIRWVSLEPQLGDVGVEPALTCSACGFNGSDLAEGRRHREDCTGLPPLDWIVVGGESGPGARPFDLAWADDVREQCRAAGTAYYLKQLGSRPVRSPATPPGAPPEPWAAHAIGCDACEHREPHWHAGKNADPSQWEPEMRVRMWPGDAWPDARR